MFNPGQLDEITERILNSIPSGIKDVQQDVQKNVRAALQGAFTKMDLVSREEFEVQAAVLARTRAKLDGLEKQLAELEQQLLNK